MSKLTPRQKIAARRVRVVAAFNQGETFVAIAIRERIANQTIYRDLRSQGIHVSLLVCARDGRRARPPKLRIQDIKAPILVCPACAKTLISRAGIQLA